MTITAEQEAAAHELMLSPTMQLLLQFAHDLPMDVTNREDLRTGLCTTSVELIRALDAGRLHFTNAEDRAMLFGLLSVVMEIIYDGRFAALSTAGVGHA
jgi:sulfur transfer protein SufE